MADIIEVKKIYREKAVTMLCVAMCRIAGIEPVDSLDGSHNYWMFNQDAEKVVDDILTRFPVPDEMLMTMYEKAQEQAKAREAQKANVNPE